MLLFSVYDFTSPATLPAASTFDPTYVNFTAGNSVALRIVDSTFDTPTQLAAGTFNGNGQIAILTGGLSSPKVAAIFPSLTSNLLAYYRMDAKYTP